LHTGRPDPLVLADMAYPRRWILTRTRRVYTGLSPDRTVLVLVDDPEEQLRELFSRLGIQRRDLKPLTRCTLCNDALVEASPSELAGSIPDYVAQHQRVFRRCPGCRRLYWPGTHVSRMMARLDDWFR
jgi:uncharacterized protein with PIN domain